MSEVVEGAVVQLKSGGPEMTVYGKLAMEPTSVICQWFDGKDLKKDTFPITSLDVVEDD